jgi:hypothetical protein
MDPQVQASFIPKKPIDSGLRRSGGTFGLFFILALLVFITSLVAAGAAFLYQGHLQAQLTQDQVSLKLNQDAYAPAALDELIRLDNRINNAEQLLSKHVAPSQIFDYLGSQTLQSVYYTSYDYSLGTDGSAHLSLSGVADSFASVALQSDQFGNNTNLKDVVFSNIASSGKGAVSFTVVANLNPNLILYSNEFATSTTP